MHKLKGEHDWPLDTPDNFLYSTWYANAKRICETCGFTEETPDDESSTYHITASGGLPQSLNLHNWAETYKELKKSISEPSHLMLSKKQLDIYNGLLGNEKK